MRVHKKTLGLALLVFCLLLCVYLLVFNGQASTDDEQLYAILTENFALRRGANALPLFGNDRLQGKTGGVEPLHPLLGVPAYHLAQRIGAGKTQTLFLLPAIYTALTAAVLVTTLRAQNFSEKTSLAAGLLYGLTTIAFPYARTNFREPLAGLFLTAAVCFLTLTPAAAGRRKKILLAFAAIAAIVLAVLTKLITAVLSPLFFVLFFLQLSQSDKTVRRNTIFWFLVVILITAAFLFSLPLAFPSASLSRFSLRFFDYLAYTLPRLPRDHFWSALAGQFFSPGKGLFIYSPILVLSSAAPLIQTKKQRFTGILYLCFPLALAVVQALIYNDEWWNITWGTRTLLPVIPVICLASAPVIDRLLNNRKRISRGVVFALAGLGFLIQSGRLLYTDPAYVSWVVNRTGQGVDNALQWNWGLAPFFRHWQLGLTQPASDIAWLHLPTMNIPAFILIPGALIALSYTLTRWFKAERKPRLVILACSLAVTALIAAPFAARADQRYHGENEKFLEAHQVLCASAAEGDLILIDSYLHPFWWYYSNFGCAEPDWLGLPYLHRTALGGGFYYPRIPDLAQLIMGWPESGNIYLAEMDRNALLPYSEVLLDEGFDLVPVGSNDEEIVTVFRVIK